MLSAAGERPHSGHQRHHARTEQACKGNAGKGKVAHIFFKAFGRIASLISSISSFPVQHMVSPFF
jgi:hypothetical protein